MAKIDFYRFDKAQDWLQRLRNPSECIDFGVIRKKDREPLAKFLADNDFIRPDPDHEIYWWTGREMKSKYTIDIYLPVYKVVRPFMLRDADLKENPYKTCSWKRDEYYLLDYEFQMWWSEKDPEHPARS